jgi:hypothetical protein
MRAPYRRPFEEMHAWIFRRRARRLLPVLLVIVSTLAFVGARFAVPLLTAQASNPIPAENALTGNPPSEWDVTGSGDATIQGFATDISVNKGGRSVSRCRPPPRRSR